MEHDHVDRILAQWARERPDVDTSTMGVIGRIARLDRIFARAMEANFAAQGLNAGGFDVLATLRRSGPPYRLSPTQLFNTLMLSSGAMTNRIDRLEQAGYVARYPDPADRRGTLIGLTPRGRELVDAILPLHAQTQHRLLAALTAEEQALLADLLRKLLLSLEAEEFRD